MRTNHKALRAIRERTGVTATALARQCGIDKSNYAHIEAGRRNGTDTQIVALARALKIDVTAIIHDEAVA